MESEQIQNLVALHKHVKAAHKKSKQLHKYLESKADDDRVNVGKVRDVIAEISGILDEHVEAFGHYLNNEEKKRRNREAIAQKAAEMQALIGKLEQLKNS